MSESDDELNTLLDELHAVPTKTKQLQTITPTLSNENLKQFLLDQAGQLIQNGVNCVGEYKTILGGNPDTKEATALAELIKASSAAIESLNKLYIQDERSKAAIQVEQIRSSAKQHNNGAGDAVTIKLTRKELMDAIAHKTHQLSYESDVVTLE